MSPRILAPILLTSLLALLGVTPAHADSITLRRSVVFEGQGPVRLADIADLDGPRARSLAEVVVAESPTLLPRDESLGRRLDVALVRDRLAAEPGVNWAFLTLHGSSVRLREPPPSVYRSGADPADTREDPTEPIDIPIVPGTVRALAHDVLLKILKARPEDLRVRWPERHAEFLDEPVDGRLIHVQPLGSSSRIPLSITVYEGDRIVRTESIRADLSVRRRAFVVSRAVTRGTRLDNSHVSDRLMWLGPGTAPALEVLGQTTTRRLEPGSVVEVGDIEPPLVVRRGEAVTLHCVAGAVVLRSQTRALESARDGEAVRLEMTGTGQRVMARMNGKGRAVLAVPPTSAPSRKGQTP